MANRNLPNRRRNCKNVGEDIVGYSKGDSQANPPRISNKIDENTNTNKYGFFIAGNPKAQPRARASRRGTFIRMYTPDTAKAWQVAVAATAHGTISSPLTGGLKVTLDFVFLRPNSHRLKSGSLKSAAPKTHRTKPDVDNLAKCVLDAMNHIAYIDDAQIQDLCVNKRYATSSEEEGCWVTVQNAI